jgi:hypothetical protein
MPMGFTVGLPVTCRMPLTVGNLPETARVLLRKMPGPSHVVQTGGSASVQIGAGA